MSLDQLRRALKQQPHHVSPFLMLGDPKPELSPVLAAALVEAGATMLELGMPYSDPCADGPAIQEACIRARSSGTSTTQALEILAQIRQSCPDVPLNLLVYGNLVHARGYETFCQQAAQAGASSLLVPDIPMEESGSLRAACSSAGLGHVQLVAPLTGPDRLAALDATTTGFLYLAAYQGVTGTEGGADEKRNQLVRRIAPAVQNAVCLGFGLSKPRQILDSFDAGARIAVVGSHLARVIARAWEEQRNGTGRHVVECLSDAFKELI